MGLRTKLEFISIDKTGRFITLRDATGIYNAISNPGGYGNANVIPSTINSILITLSVLNSNKVYQTKFLQSYTDPDYLTNPTIISVTNGIPFELNSYNLNITREDEGFKAFSDGVIDINMYTVVDNITGVVGNSGDNFIIGTDLKNKTNLVDNIVINDILYTINKEIDTNNGTVLYLLEDLIEDTTSFRIAYRTNLKVLNNTQSLKCLTENVGKLSCSCNSNKYKKDKIFELFMYRDVAQLDFNDEDYINANELMISINKGCKSLNCNCK